MEKIFITIQESMKKQGITEQLLSDKTGIPQSTIHRLITGKNKKMDLSKIRIIQEALGIAGFFVSVSGVRISPGAPNMRDCEKERNPFLESA